MSVQYAQYETKCAPLNEPFGQELAAKWFGPEILPQLPLYVRGPKKGQIKAWLCWYKVSVGGWSRQVGGPGSGGGVLKPGVSRAWISATYAGTEDQSVRLEWCGRVQSVCGSKSVLTAEYRAEEIARQSAYKAEIEQMKASYHASGRDLGEVGEAIYGAAAR